jgi:hypothetical protein
MTTSDAAMRSPGVRTTPSIKDTVRLNFFIASNPLQFAEIEKAVDNSFTIPCGQWRRRMPKMLLRLQQETKVIV